MQYQTCQVVSYQKRSLSKICQSAPALRIGVTGPWMERMSADNGATAIPVPVGASKKSFAMTRYHRPSLGSWKGWASMERARQESTARCRRQMVLPDAEDAMRIL